MKTSISLLIYSMVTSLAILGQTKPFDIQIYKDFMTAHEDMPVSELYQLYPSDIFKATVPEYNTDTVLYFNDLCIRYGLTDDEKDLLLKHGFMVTERLPHGSYFNQFVDIYKNDLPVFVSTDAILHAFHLSYDNLLKEVEMTYLIPELKKLLGNAYSSMNSLKEKYGHLEDMQPMLRDVDVYLVVALVLLGEQPLALYPENKKVINEYLGLIESEKMESVCFFSEDMKRKIDFSQFKPRGHYEDENSDLSKYFRTMMWLGRMELYLDHPDYKYDELVRATVHRQIMDAVLIHELLCIDDNADILNAMEDIISFFVGEQDNVSPVAMKQLLTECEIISAEELLDEENINRFLASLRNGPFAGQQILSQVFKGNKDGTTRPLPSAFMPFGQRFVIDSYVTGQVVYDRITDNGSNMCRLIPSTLDIMFTLGNDAALQLLIPELQKWHYSDNLAGLRFLIEQYDEEFWGSSLYNLWLYAIQSLNPDPGNEDLPDFMKTGAWGLKKLNSQLGSWAELRHDNLLYAKQSYTSHGDCIHPKGYVEPNPEFFRRMKRLAEIAGKKFTTLDGQFQFRNSPVSFFQNMDTICDILQNIAEKELSGEELSDEQCVFLNDISFMGLGGSGGPYFNGWYPKLIYGDQNLAADNLVVADYHTTPTDCVGTPLGWVCHAGTGIPDLAIVVAPLANGTLCSFVGPVTSYHEYKTSNFLRLTDSEWAEEYLRQSFRPQWVYNYIANGEGKAQNAESRFFTDKNELLEALNYQSTSLRDNKTPIPKIISVAPNPVEHGAMITLNIPTSSHGLQAKLYVFDLSGKMVKMLINGPLPSGYFITEWNCSNESGNRVPPGSYFLVWEQGNLQDVKQIMVVK